ncbi:hypothetical protein [Brevundimonas variabilis]|uniref:Uncharacterized protein n=1 Tax=Brevundimonas variabilis TaxID=74312 RepID=A0A7W9CIJ6_9CAUL|nr:hypothetical protein [Brevundimonas variabilis]MBB5746303.1 hypothetical protein [Brevundimonas variabilis]
MSLLGRSENYVYCYAPIDGTRRDTVFVNDSFRRNVGLIHKPHVRDQVGVNLPTEPRCTSLSRAAVDPNHGGNLSSIQPSGPHEQFLSARLEVWAEEVLPKAMAQREIWHLASACLSDCLSC